MKNRYEENELHQRGAALVTAILALLLVTLLGFAMVTVGMSAFDISVNTTQNTEAFYIAESGLIHSISLVSSAGPTEFDNILSAGDGLAGTGDELSTQPAGSTPIPLAGLTFGRGNYRVFVSDDAADTDGNPNEDSNGRLVLTAISTGRDGATATIEAIVSVSNVPSIPAILVDGNLLINGNPEIEGSNGAVHSNGTLDFDGNPCADQYFSSSSNIVEPEKAMGPGCGGSGTTLPNQPVIPSPTYDIRTDFYTNSDFILGALGAQAGKVYDGAGNLIVDTSTTGDKWTVGSSEWSWDSGNKRWVHGGDAIQNGTYYSEANMEIGDSFGTSGSPAQVTLISEGYLTISGNPFMTPDYLDYSLMAGTDLQISGSPSAGETNLNGIHYAHHQFGFSGDPAINGVVLGANVSDLNSPGCGCNPVPLEPGGFMMINGNPIITYDGSLFGSGTSTTNLISWREIRN